MALLSYKGSLVKPGVIYRNNTPIPREDMQDEAFELLLKWRDVAGEILLGVIFFFR